MSATSESIVHRISQLPLVTSAYGWSSNYYAKVKNSSSLLKSTLETVEESMAFTTGKMSPVLQKLDKPLAAVNTVACKALTKLQESYPSVNKSPEEIAAGMKGVWNDVRLTARFENVKQYGVRKVVAVKDYGYQTVSSLAASQYDQVTATFNFALCKVDQYVEYYLPSDTEDRTEDQMCKDEVTSAKAKKMASKVGGRIFARAQFHLKQIQNFTPTQRLHQCVSLVQTSASTTRVLLQDRLASARTKATVYWNEIPQKLDETEKQIVSSSFGKILMNSYTTSLTFVYSITSRLQLTGFDVSSRFYKIVNRLKAIDVTGMLTGMLTARSRPVQEHEEKSN